MGIGNKLVFDVNNNVEDFTFILSTRDYRHLGAISNINRESVVYNAHLNSANDIQFEVYKSYKKKDKNINESLWNDIVDLKLVYVKELNEYFEITVSLDDSNENIKKTITATSLCESELSQAYINGLEVNTESDIARDDYAITTFYNWENTEGSLLHRVLSYVPHYTLKHVDSSLINLQRSFSVDGTSVYDFLTGDCAKQFNCIFKFDSTTREVYVYDLYTVCEDCGHRADSHIFSDGVSDNYICPECGSRNIKYFGTDTTIFVDKENLTEEIQFTTDMDSVKNCLKLVAGDDIMTSTVRLLNANGSDNIVYITDEQKKDMPQELVDKLNSYDELYSSKIDGYEEIINNIYESIDKINYYTHSMLPTIEQSKVTAKTEADKLTSSNLNLLGLATVNEHTSISTIESALKNYAKVFIKTGYVKLEINNSAYNYIGIDIDGHSYGVWAGNFKITNNSDKEDIAYTSNIRVKVYDDYQSFIEQKIMKNIATDDKEGSIFDVLSIEDLDDFSNALSYYCLNRLTSFYEAIQTAMDTLIEVNQANASAELYEVLYLPYYKKLQACQSEIDERQSTIDEWTQIYETSSSQQAQIQKELNLENYLGENLYKIFCAYRREDTYQNTNYISDGLTDSEIIEHAREFIDVANEELIKAATYRHSISTTLYNLLVIPEFKPIIDKFELGNWIRIRIDNDIYRLRLIGYALSFSSIQTLEVEFSDVTKVKGVGSDINEILDSAKSMSTNFSYVSKQASKGEKSSEEINDWVKYGLNSALVRIKNNEKEEVTFGNQGLFCKSYDDISDSYSQEQLRVTHNILAFTEDNWKTCSLGLGKHDYVYYDKENEKFEIATGYGLTSKFSQNSYIYGSQIIGGEIISENYSSTTGTYINLKDGTFSFGGGKITYNGNSLILNGVDLMWADIVDAPTKVSEFENDSGYQNAIQVTKITKDTVTAPFIKTLNLTVGKEIIMGSNATISWNNVTNQPTIPSRTSQLTNDAGYQNSSQVTTITKNTITTSYVNALNITAGSVAAENITGTYISGKTISGGKIIGTEISNGNGTFYVNENGSVSASDINITGGTIGEFKLYYSRTSGSYYLETIPTTSAPLTTGIGNHNTWAFWTGYSYSTNTASFWVTNSGEVHMKNWLYGTTKNSWVIWTKTDLANRYGLEYIFGDWDPNQKIMNIKFVFHDYSNGQKFHYNLPLTGTISGMP